MSNIKDLTLTQLKQVIEIREQIDALQAQLASIGGGPRLGRPPKIKFGVVPERGGKRRMSAAGRAAIAAAAKARWAKYRGGESETATKPGRKGKRRFSAKARAALAASAKARWAKAKASGKSTL